tara:strand:+ start:723478 stop:724734 length:1257 start_codon:yes stop_codon:yes gene_type:complete
MRLHIKKLNASALQFAVLISVIIIILLGSFITLTYTHGLFKKQSGVLLQTIDEANKGIKLSLSEPLNVDVRTTIVDENKGLFIKKNVWGGFIEIESTSENNNKMFTQRALIGEAIKNRNLGIYVSEQKMPLQLVDNAKIVGDAYISDVGIKSGNIYNTSFNGNTLVYGDIKKSQATLPALDLFWQQNISDFFNYLPESHYDYIDLDFRLRNSFDNRTKVIFNQGSMHITSEAVGNIIFKSNSEIIVTSSAFLEDVFLIAPRVVFEKNFKGTAHVLADTQIKMEENVSLHYPSSLILTDKNSSLGMPPSNEDEPVFFAPNSNINGVVIYLKNENSENNTNISIRIDENSTVFGSVYCEGNLALNGTVNGNVYTERFIVNLGSKFINYIFNGIIDRKGLNESFVGLPLQQNKKGIVKWLY